MDRKRPPFRIWVPERTVLVLGNSQIPSAELILDRVLQDGIPIYRRIGGGGAVVLNSSCVCYALRLQRIPGTGIHDYFALGSGLLQSLLRKDWGIEAIPRGISDLCIGERKILGCSLYLSRDYALYLASILVHDCTTDVERYLRHPSSEPDYRAGRAHREFLSSLGQEIPGFPTPLTLAADLLRHLQLSTLPLDWTTQPWTPSHEGTR